MYISIQCEFCVHVGISARGVVSDTSVLLMLEEYLQIIVACAGDACCKKCHHLQFFFFGATSHSFPRTILEYWKPLRIQNIKFKFSVNIRLLTLS